MIRTREEEAKYVAFCMSQPVLTDPLNGYVRTPLKSHVVVTPPRLPLRARLYAEATAFAKGDDAVLEAKYEELLFKYGLT